MSITSIDLHDRAQEVHSIAHTGSFENIRAPASVEEAPEALLVLQVDAKLGSSVCLVSMRLLYYQISGNVLRWPDPAIDVNRYRHFILACGIWESTGHDLPVTREQRSSACHRA